MQLFYQSEIPRGVHFLDPEESRHCIKVLRKREGDEIHVVDGVGATYVVVITEADPKKCTFTIQHVTQRERRDYTIHIAIAPTKNADRMEWFLEKAIEIGVDSITFLECEHSERAKINHERLTKKAVSAMKQSLRSSLPAINVLQTFPLFVETVHADQKFIAYVDNSQPNHLKDQIKANKNYVILIGPEGDFSQSEINLAFKNGFKAASLGTSRLRTETAGMAASLIFNLMND